MSTLLITRRDSRLDPIPNGRFYMKKFSLVLFALSSLLMASGKIHEVKKRFAIVKDVGRQLLVHAHRQAGTRLKEGLIAPARSFAFQF